MTRIITVTSGKGGVGKTNISANLALHLAELGYRVCLFDADFGLANINILLKIYPDFNLKDVILGQKKIKDIVIEDYMGIDIIPGSSGIEEMADLSTEQIISLIRSFSDLEHYDFLIIDTAAGVSKAVVAFCLASYELILVIIPDPSSLTDAYALLKILFLNDYKESVMVVVNQSSSLEHAKRALSKLASTTERFLSLKLIPVGIVKRDKKVLDAVERQMPFVSLFPESHAAKSIKLIARNLLSKKVFNPHPLDMGTFWEKCLYFFTKTLKAPGGKKKIVQQQGAVSSSLSVSGSTSEADSPEIVKANDFHGKKIQTENTLEKGSGQLLNPVSEDYTLSRTKDPLVLETNRLLQNVVESISSMADEIKGIRELLQFHRQVPESNSKEKGIVTAPLEKEPSHDKSIKQLAEHLSSYLMFQSLEDRDIRAIASRLKLKEYQPGEIIIQKGEPGKKLFIIMSGKVEVVDDQSVVLDSMEKEDVFGEMSLISGDPVNATIRVVERARVLYLDGKSFINMLAQYPPLQMFFARLLSRRLANRIKKADLSKAQLLESGLVGNLGETSIAELIQMLNMGQKTGLLSFYFTADKAFIAFNNGGLVHAQYGTETGKEAFFKILLEKDGRFVYRSDIPKEYAEKPEIGHFMRLLMEGMSLIDEKNH